MPRGSAAPLWTLEVQKEPKSRISTSSPSTPRPTTLSSGTSSWCPDPCVSSTCCLFLREGVEREELEKENSPRKPPQKKTKIAQEVIRTNLSVREGIEIIVSMGMALPKELVALT